MSNQICPCCKMDKEIPKGYAICPKCDNKILTWSEKGENAEFAFYMFAIMSAWKKGRKR